MFSKNFIGRKDLIQDFVSHYQNLRDGESKIIYYTGVAGIGKTALLKYLADSRIARLQYVYHDFDSITNMKNVLKKLARRLSSFGLDFPLFETGCYLYEKSTGENTFPPRQKSFLSDYPGISNIVGLATAAFTVAGTAGAVPIAFAAADFAQKNQQDILEWLDKIYSWCVKNFNLDDENARYRQYLRETIDMLKANAEKVQDENQLENQLVELFANDLAYSLRKSKRPVAVILDSYEILMLRGRKTKEHPEPDWWLKEKLLREVPNVIWILGGRGKLNYDEELSAKIIQRELQPFDGAVSLKFLESRGIENNKPLCYHITKITRGYPLYLELCAEQYRLLKKKDRHHEPEFSDFAPENEDFQKRVGKIVVNLIECMDDTGIRETIKYLCALKSWTDEMAYAIVPAFNETAYNMVKNFSFVRLADKEDANDEDNFRFDETVHEILIRKYKRDNKFVIRKTLELVNEHFRQFIPESYTEPKNPVSRYLIRLWLSMPSMPEKSNSTNIAREISIVRDKLIAWANILVRLIDDAETLQRQCENNFGAFLNGGAKIFSDVYEEIAAAFFAKAKQISSVNSAPYAYFELLMGNVRDVQGLPKDSLAYAKSAHKKFVRLDDCQEYVLDAMWIKVNAYFALGLQQQEIETALETLKLSRMYYFDSDNEKILDAMCRLMIVFRRHFLFAECVKVQEDALKLCSRLYGSTDNLTLDFMDDLAENCLHANQLERAVALKENILAHFKKISDAEKFLHAVLNLELTLERTQNFDRGRALMLETIAFAEKEYGENNFRLVRPMFALARNLHALKLTEETLAVHDKIIALYQHNIDRRIETFGENSYKVLVVIDELLHDLEVMSNYGFEIHFYDSRYSRRSEMEKWSARKVKIVESLLAELPQTDASTEKFALLKELESALWIDEAKRLEVRQQILELAKANFSATDEKVIDAMHALARSYAKAQEFDKASELNRAAADVLVKRLDESFIAELAVQAIDAIYDLIDDTDDELEKINLERQILEIRGKMLDAHFDDDVLDKIIDDNKTLAKDLINYGDEAEAVRLAEQALALSVKYYGDSANSSIIAARNLIEILVKTRNFDRAFTMGEKIFSDEPDKLAEILEKKGDYRAATPFREEVVKFYAGKIEPPNRKNFGVRQHFIYARYYLAKDLLKAGETDRALDLLRENVQLFENLWGNDDSEIAVDEKQGSKEDLANALFDAGKFDEVLAVWKMSVDSYEKDGFKISAMEKWIDMLTEIGAVDEADKWRKILEE